MSRKPPTLEEAAHELLRNRDYMVVGFSESPKQVWYLNDDVAKQFEAALEARTQELIRRPGRAKRRRR